MSFRSADASVAAELSDRGLRATRQRVHVLRLLRRQRGHPTAAELHRQLLREQPRLSQKTVYEILDALVGAGLASRAAVHGQAARYEARPEPHDHASCRSCGRLYDMPGSAAAQVRARAKLPAGFQPESVEVTIHGVCGRCRDGT
jgi:Fe2+ or Zn2+ uptake regulation protein